MLMTVHIATLPAEEYTHMFMFTMWNTTNYSGLWNRL